MLVNPMIVESSGEWVYEEGACRSPASTSRSCGRRRSPHRLGPRRQRGQLEADELLARLFQHELDHLDGVLMFERMTADQRKEALKEWRGSRRATRARPAEARLRLDEAGRPLTVPLAPVPAHPRRLVFLGTPAMAVPPLEPSSHAGFDVALVVTRPDKRRAGAARCCPAP